MNAFGPLLPAFGLVVGIVTLFTIGLGFPLVILCERYLGRLWWPWILCLGLAAIVVSCLVEFDLLSAILGLIGATLAWASTELDAQSRRVDAGWYPRKVAKLKAPLESIFRNWKAPTL
jgi:hypothetical protein